MSTTLSRRIALEEEKATDSTLHLLKDARPKRSLSTSPVRYGIDREIQFTRKGKYDVQLEEQAIIWLEKVSCERIDCFYSSLKSGEMLCEVINKIVPDTIKKINHKQNGFMEQENIRLYLEACIKFGIPNHLLFSPADLHSNKDLTFVVRNLHALADTAHRLNPSIVSMEYVIGRYNFDNIPDYSHYIKLLQEHDENTEQNILQERRGRSPEVKPVTNIMQPRMRRRSSSQDPDRQKLVIDRIKNQKLARERRLLSKKRRPRSDKRRVAPQRDLSLEKEEPPSYEEAIHQPSFIVSAKTSNGTPKKLKGSKEKDTPKKTKNSKGKKVSKDAMQSKIVELMQRVSELELDNARLNTEVSKYKTMVESIKTMVNRV